jgi:hypothetical protein
MAKSSKIKVMISSRCNDMFPLSSKPQIRLSDLRTKMKKEIEGTTVLGSRPFEVWINEDAAESAELDAWDECMRQARECDIFVVLFNGNAGWTGTGENASIGICHAEFLTAYARAPAKVFLIDIFERRAANAPKKPADVNFQKRLERENRFGSSVADVPSLEEAIRSRIVSATIKLVHQGVADAIRGKGYLGPALDWNRMPYPQRSAAMVAAAAGALGSTNPTRDGNFCVATIERKRILFRVGAVPDSMSVATAREMVGQPHLRDDTAAARVARLDGGPVHLIACHKGVTGTQAQRMLGFPDATVVAAPFGVYVLDPVQAIQIVLLANCADESATRHNVQRFMEWLPQSEQSELLAKFAGKRKDLVALLATQP